MQRSAALAPLSRDHQHALDAALRLRRATPGTIAEAIDRFERFFEEEGRKHFAIEERLLVPALDADDPEWSEPVARMLDDHRWIRAAADALAVRGEIADPVGSANELGQRLNDHVRFEERVLFEILERRLAGDELDRLGRAVEAAERAGG
jgi:hemerythrin-like domain-containing protein